MIRYFSSALLMLGSLISSQAAIIGYVPTGQTGTLSTLVVDASFVVYDQNDQNPCVIGDPSCKEGALGNGNRTLLSENVDEYNDIFSPFYQVSMITGIVGNTFSLGLDLNNTEDEQRFTEIGMYLYSTADESSPLSSQSWTGDAFIAAVNNGSGKSDVIFQGFDLTGINSTYYVRFFLDMPEFPDGTPAVNDGREVLFLINDGGGSGGNEVPEPSTYALIGGALIGLQMLRKRK